jgi:hypothetical protein
MDQLTSQHTQLAKSCLSPTERDAVIADMVVALEYTLQRHRRIAAALELEMVQAKVARIQSRARKVVR